jgi:hypothetical protein
MAFTFAAFCYIVALIIAIFLIFLAVYHVIAFDELKNDHKNPIDQCKILNPVILLEYGLHTLIVLLFMISFEFITVVLNLPLFLYHVHRYLKRPSHRSMNLYDPTTILNGHELSRATTEGWAKLAFYLLSFFYFLYCMISTLVA